MKPLDLKKNTLLNPEELIITQTCVWICTQDLHQGNATSLPIVISYTWRFPYKIFFLLGHLLFMIDSFFTPLTKEKVIMLYFWPVSEWWRTSTESLHESQTHIPLSLKKKKEKSLLQYKIHQKSKDFYEQCRRESMKSCLHW